MQPVLKMDLMAVLDVADLLLGEYPAEETPGVLSLEGYTRGGVTELINAVRKEVSDAPATIFPESKRPKA